METPVIEISARAKNRLSAGYLWIFSNEVTKKPATIAPGSWCHFVSNAQPAATGYYNGHSLIAGRALLVGGGVSENVVEENLRQAFERRRSMMNPSNTGVRLVFSEADFLPGLIIDQFSDHVVVQSNTAGADLLLPRIEAALPGLYTDVFGRKPKSLYVRGDSAIRKLEGLENFKRIVFGDEASLKEVEFLEGNVRYAADLIDGQKTGFFLDQRDNRAYLAEALKGKKDARVLDLFCYSGGWGLQALKAGATHVTFVDESDAAAELTAKAITRNGFDDRDTRFMIQNVFDFLPTDTETYDVVVCDPPAFVKSAKDLPKAKRAYEKLNRLAYAKVKVGGLLITSTCSYHMSESDFNEAVIEAAGKSGGAAHIVYRGFQAQDHPVLLSMPETQYLKCLGILKLK